MFVVSFMIQPVTTTLKWLHTKMFTNIVFVEVWMWKGRVAFLLTDAPCLFYAETVLLPRFDFLMGFSSFLARVIKYLMFIIGNSAHR